MLCIVLWPNPHNCVHTISYLSDAVRREVHRNHHAGHAILLQTQFAHEEIVDHVLRAQQQLDGMIRPGR